MDPLIGSQLRLDGKATQASFQRHTAAAYNSVDNEYLMVWEDGRDSKKYTRIYGQFVAADGMLVGNNFTIASNGFLPYAAPDVAYNPDANNYLVTWTTNLSTLMARVVSASGSGGPELLVSDGSTPTTSRL